MLHILIELVRSVLNGLVFPIPSKVGSLVFDLLVLRGLKGAIHVWFEVGLRADH